jgi:hypothetical protein
MTKNISEYFMAYEATKVFAIQRMKTQFTNKNTHILSTDILQKQCRKKLFLIEELKTRAEVNAISWTLGEVLTEFWKSGNRVLVCQNVQFAYNLIELNERRRI